MHKKVCSFLLDTKDKMGKKSHINAIQDKKQSAHKTCAMFLNFAVWRRDQDSYKQMQHETGNAKSQGQRG